MMKWQRLTEYARTSLPRGALLKFPASYPFEDVVVMMVCEGPNSSSERCLRTITGHKAGINCYQAFPEEATNEHDFVSSAWLIQNWNKWVWPGGDVNDVLVREPLNAFEL